MQTQPEACGDGLLSCIRRCSIVRRPDIPSPAQSPGHRCLTAPFRSRLIDHRITTAESPFPSAMETSLRRSNKLHSHCLMCRSLTPGGIRLFISLVCWQKPIEIVQLRTSFTTCINRYLIRHFIPQVDLL